MVKSMIDVPELIAKSEDGDFLRELIHDAAERLMDDAEHDVLAYMAFDGELRRKLHSTTRRRG